MIDENSTIQSLFASGAFRLRTPEEMKAALEEPGFVRPMPLLKWDLSTVPDWAKPKACWIKRTMPRSARHWAAMKKSWKANARRNAKVRAMCHAIARRAIDRQTAA